MRHLTEKSAHHGGHYTRGNEEVAVSIISRACYLHRQQRRQAKEPHYPRSTELCLFDIPKLIYKCTDKLKKYGIGRVQMCYLMIDHGCIQLYINYFPALDNIPSEVVMRGNDGVSGYRIHQLEIDAQLCVMWQRRVTGVCHG